MALMMLGSCACKLGEKKFQSNLHRFVTMSSVQDFFFFLGGGGGLGALLGLNGI